MTNTIANPSRVRIQSIDIVRGAVMVLMAIDHVRVYSGVPAGGPTADIFFTRWVTHFCVSVFVFFAGTSAFLYGRQLSKSSLAGYLVSRGLLLIVLELTLIRFFWTFNLALSEFMLAGVIWMLGWCMILLAAFIWVRPVVLGIAGVIVIAGQKLFSYVPDLLPPTARVSFGKVWSFIYPSGLEGPQGISILYHLVPWIGVMMAGYGFGLILMKDVARRNKICLWIGLSATLIFLIAGSIEILSKPSNPEAPPFTYQLLGQRKYPASILFLLMTLGPAIALIPFAEKARGWLARVLQAFGKVPFFFYLLHILFIHGSALLVNFIRVGKTGQEWYKQAPFTFMEDPATRWSLPLLYLVFLGNVAVLYFVCRWYAGYKATQPEKKWLKYL
jgi:uncharacterized membrane protein